LIHLLHGWELIEADLRAIIYLDGNTVWTVDIGTHAVYR